MPGGTVTWYGLESFRVTPGDGRALLGELFARSPTWALLDEGSASVMPATASDRTSSGHCPSRSPSPELGRHAAKAHRPLPSTRRGADDTRVARADHVRPEALQGGLFEGRQHRLVRRRLHIPAGADLLTDYLRARSGLAGDENLVEGDVAAPDLAVPACGALARPGPPSPPCPLPPGPAPDPLPDPGPPDPPPEPWPPEPLPPAPEPAPLELAPLDVRPPEPAPGRAPLAFPLWPGATAWPGCRPAPPCPEPGLLPLPVPDWA